MKDYFDCHGLILEAGSSSADLVENVRRDFTYFYISGDEKETDLRVQIVQSHPE